MGNLLARLGYLLGYFQKVWLRHGFVRSILRTNVIVIAVECHAHGGVIVQQISFMEGEQGDSLPHKNNFSVNTNDSWRAMPPGINRTLVYNHVTIIERSA